MSRQPSLTAAGAGANLAVCRGAGQLTRATRASRSSWYGFTKNINEGMLREMGEGMVSSGLAAAGYEHIWCGLQTPLLLSMLQRRLRC